MEENPKPPVTTYITAFAFGPGVNEAFSRYLLGVAPATKLDIVGDPSNATPEGWPFTVSIDGAVDRTIERLLRYIPHTVFLDLFLTIELDGRAHNLTRLNYDPHRGLEVDGRVLT